VPVSRAPKNATKKKSVAKKSAVAKKSNKKVDTKKAKKGPRLFPTKAELEALKASKENKGAAVEKLLNQEHLLPQPLHQLQLPQKLQERSLLRRSMVKTLN